MPSSKADHPEMHLAASAIAAIINFPLWKASAMGQSGFDRGMKGGILKRYIEAMKPPYKGMTATIVGMTWARAFIFYGSDRGKRFLEDRGNKDMVSVLLPPLVCSTAVQLINMPIIRARQYVGERYDVISASSLKHFGLGKRMMPHCALGTATLLTPLVDIPLVSACHLDPATKYISTADALRGIYQSKGLQGLWHGTSAGVMKTVPKYCVAVAVKNYMERTLRPANPDDRMDSLIRSAKKSVMAGVAGAALTNPVDVVRNEMFKTDLGVHKAFLKLWREEGTSFALRGINKNLVAVAIPIAVTIFCTDFLVQLKEGAVVEGGGKQGHCHHHHHIHRRREAAAVAASPSSSMVPQKSEHL